jgi:ATP-binding cassette, subfamily B, bacterial
LKKFPHFQQFDAMDCGPSCLRMVAKYYGKSYSLESLRAKSGISREGVSLLGISEAAEAIGFRTMAVKINYEQLVEEAPLPAILHWNQNHFVVIAPKRSIFNWFRKSSANGEVLISDPAKGLINYKKHEFLQHWISDKKEGVDEGVALLLEATPRFYEQEDEKQNKVGFKMLFGYLFQYKKLLWQLIMGLAIGSLLQLILPFLTQSIVDIGINTRNLTFVYIVLAAQLMLFFGRTMVDFIRSRLLLYISSRINISILSDFFIKLMKLPMGYFDTKMTGDIMQRIADHHRIESFLTGNTLNVLFSMVNLVVFSIVLLFFNSSIFFLFAIASVLYFLWITIFLKYRRALDFKRFDIASKENSKVLQLVQGMQEIKMNNSEKQKRWEWERLQSRLFKLSFKSLSLSQYQQAGAFFINEGKNIMITFLAAKSVIDGQLTLGGMLAVQYIIGNLNGPIEQLIGFVQSLQDAKISLERLNEIHTMQDEEPADKGKIDIMPSDRSIYIRNLSYQYPGAGNELVLEDINLTIPSGKTTAIVGMSGSGKTTLLKLLLKFYDPKTGEIKIGDSRLENMSNKLWRSKCGVVMQDGFIFSDTISNNITIGHERVEIDKLIHAVNVANIQEFVEGLPLGYNTMIGAEGNGISQGQRQRILIARSVYKDPEYIFFDEATNALDANNEMVIMENLEEFFKGRTVVVVAHRLSTVKNADQIVVLNKGKIVEQGTHEELTAKRGEYYTLVKNQLELGN